MSQKFEFIKVQPNNADAKSDRRRIRSQAARAGNIIDQTRVPVRLAPKSKSKEVVSCPPAPSNQSDKQSDSTDKNGCLDVVQDHKSEVIRLEDAWHSKPLVPQYVVIPFSGNHTILPISQSKLYSLPFLSLVLDNCESNPTRVAEAATVPHMACCRC